MNKIKRNDTVVMIAGRDKGRTGRVLRVVKDKKNPNNLRYVVEGANMVTKHVRPNPNAGVEGGRVKMEASVHASNVAIWNPLTKKADRVGIKTLDDGKKVRVFKSDGEQIDI